MLAPLSILKKFRMNVRAALGSEAGRKGKSRKGISRAKGHGERASNHYTRMVFFLLTPRLQLIGTPSQELLYLLRLHLLARPSIVPVWFWRRGRYHTVCVRIFLF